MKLRDRTNEKYGRLLVVARDLSKSRVSWVCRCDCGTVLSVDAANLARGNTASCGCLRREVTIARSIDQAKHGHTRQRTQSREWKSWQAMLHRCLNPHANGYRLYGGRGIAVCAQWQGKDGFSQFYKDMGKRPAGHSLDRIDPDGHYEPSNCRWATAAQQAQNRRKTPEYRASQLASLARGRETRWGRPPTRDSDQTP